MGAMGVHGGGVVRAILTDRSSQFLARAITRKPESDRAQALAKLGAKVVAGDADDSSSLERAFAGAYGRRRSCRRNSADSEVNAV